MISWPLACFLNLCILSCKVNLCHRIHPLNQLPHFSYLARSKSAQKTDNLVAPSAFRINRILKCFLFLIIFLYQLRNNLIVLGFVETYSLSIFTLREAPQYLPIHGSHISHAIQDAAVFRNSSTDLEFREAK